MMTEEEMRIAIAEKCGWYGINKDCLDDCVCFNSQKVMYEGVPNYPKDLNAMHEAEKVMSKDQFEQYRETLSDMLGDECRIGLGFHATALQRAEAFCRVVFPERWEK